MSFLAAKAKKGRRGWLALTLIINSSRELASFGADSEVLIRRALQTKVDVFCPAGPCMFSEESPDAPGTQQSPGSMAQPRPPPRGGPAHSAALSPTCHGEAGPIALPGLPTILVLGDAAVGGEGILLLHVGDVQPAVLSNKKPVFWRHNQDILHYPLAGNTTRNKSGLQPAFLPELLLP